MFVKHLQEYLDKFTEGSNGRRGNAVSNARIYIATKGGYLEEIKRIEVHESNNPRYFRYKFFNFLIKFTLWSHAVFKVTPVYKC